ncbi:MAG: haloacid dehalogenase [Anaerolineae bacterium]|jgi:translin
MSSLEEIIQNIREEWTEQNNVRDLTLQRSRMMIRSCANSIRATHRHEFPEAQALLEQAQEEARLMVADAAPFGDILGSGYLLDALKEMAEAALTLALVTGGDLPTPESLGVPSAPYLNGMGEAAGELRRFALDAIRRDDLESAERMLSAMDDIYSHLVTMDFPDTLTRGLRRTTDMVRGVTERTRGDLTTAVRENMLQRALIEFEQRLQG